MGLNFFQRATPGVKIVSESQKDHFGILFSWHQQTEFIKIAAFSSFCIEEGGPTMFVRL